MDKQGKPVDYDTSGLRRFGKDLSQERLRLYTKGKLGVIIDGTGHKFDKIKKKKKRTNGFGLRYLHGFCKYFTTDKLRERNEKRDRVIPDTIVRKSWEDVQNNWSFSRFIWWF